MLRAWIAIAPMLLCSGNSIHVKAQQAAYDRTRPTFFEPNDDNGNFKGAKPPSDAVLDVLLQSSQVRENLEKIEDQSRESLRGYFKAVLADDGESQDQVYVVTSTKLPLGSGDSDWFWVVQVRKQEVRVILFTIGHTLTFKNHKSKGYRDILQTTGTPSQPETNLYRFDGDAYRLFRERLLTVKP